MRCSQCGLDNPAGNRFCGGCGQRLALSGEDERPFGRVDDPGHGERRQATVLFSDLSGYTQMNEKLDPEEVKELMNRFKAAAVRIVEDHGGIVNQFVGDEVLALFGIPKAHEDDPRRAVRTALKLHELARKFSPEVEAKLGMPLRMHSGVDSGLVVTDTRDTRDGRFGITGDTVNIGARLKALADADEILLSPSTQVLVAPFFAMDPLPAVALKGKRLPITPHRVMEEFSEPQVVRRPFVGRDAEMAACTALLDEAVQSGRGRAVLLRGEPGIGKSRVVQELIRLASERQFACHTGLVLDFGTDEAHDAIRSLLRAMLQAMVGSSDLHGIAQRLVAEQLLAESQVPFLIELLGLAHSPQSRSHFEAMSTEAREQALDDTIRHLVRAVGGSAPHLLVVEDVHWADPVTVRRLKALMEATQQALVVLAMTSRVEGPVLSTEWLQESANSAILHLHLMPLPESEALLLAGGFLDATNRFAEQCVKRAEGNPLFLEQLLHSAEESAEEEVPGSVQSVVLARIDRLAAEDRQVLQAASVLGQRFEPDALRFLLGLDAIRCERLVEHQLVRPEGMAYLFCHALIQEGIYSSLLKARRRQLHGQAAQWFAAKDPVLYAEHLQRAEDPAAAQAYLDAARSLAEKYRYERALALVAKGLALAADGPERVALICMQGQLQHDLGAIRESIASYQEAVTLAADSEQQCRAWIGLAAGMRVVDQYDQALAALDKAEAQAIERNLTLDRAQLSHLRGNIFFPLGNIDGCLEQHGLALQFAREAGSIEYQARALGGLGDAYYLRGRMQTAYDHFTRCVELCRSENLTRIELSYADMVGWCSVYMMDLPASEKLGLVTGELARTMGAKREEMLCRLTAGRVLLEQDRLDDAGRELGRGLELADSLGANRFRSFFTIFQARVEAATRGNSPAVDRMLEESLKLARQTGFEFIGPWLLSTRALFTSDAGIRRSCLAEGEAILQAGCVGHNYFEFYRDAIDVSLTEGAWAEAERYAKALEVYAQDEPLPWSDFIAERGRALAAFGRGLRDAGLGRTLRELKERGRRADCHRLLVALEQALAAA